ncbi:MAG TPA: CDP-alcohol phosphatidyltransferase family protein [Ohtaekwangia sp.]|uniref:CDP-alcohol phosphatidyltransferase family protein n=1 Tax=Ohtaekwangia sp. TaxID=2066019 RepID=UPI002F94C3D8
MNTDKQSRISYYVINGITMYRLVSAPFLLLLAIKGESDWFKWLIAFSFLTDAIDGPLSRKFEVTSVFGARLDSVADDATVLVSTLGLWIMHREFIYSHWIVIAGLFALFGIQTIAALIAYRKVTSFHTYLAKTAAVVQAIFFLLMFFAWPFSTAAFYIACAVTGIQLVEEIILVIILPEWKANVKGLYWVWRPQRKPVNKAQEGSNR